MSNGFIFRFAPTATVIGSPYEAAGFPGSNTLDRQPKVVFKSVPISAGQSIAIQYDLGADVPVDGLALLFHNASASATMSVTAATAAAGPSAQSIVLAIAAARSPFIGSPSSYHRVVTWTRVTARYWTFFVTEPAARGGMTIGVARFGTLWAPGWNFETGRGRRINDLSDKRELPGGELGIWRKAKAPLIRLSWGDLADSEVDDLDSMLAEIGESEPLVLVEDPDFTAGLHNRIHYGVLDGVDFYERQMSNKSRWELKMREWL